MTAWLAVTSQALDSATKPVPDGRGGRTVPESESDPPPRVDRDLLRNEIVRHLAEVGLNGKLPDEGLSKEAIRHIHRFHREAAQQRIRRALGSKVERFVDEIANGDEVDPEDIRPELIEARAGSRTGDLFRFAALLWSIPVSQGYGRRLRFLVRDQSNGKLIGIFALGDPVFNLRVRDDWIGWNQEGRRNRLVNVMDAYVVGAVPPYSSLLGGKLVASLIASKEVASAFEERYGNRPGLISGRQKRARLALVTVTSALGRSSIYNRLRLMRGTPGLGGQPAVELLKLGTTTGYGHFQITDELFAQLRTVLQEDEHMYADGHQFGDGPNWRIRVARQALQSLGLDPNDILRHGIKRDVYAMPIAANPRAFLAGRVDAPVFDCMTVDEIAALARTRWVVPRSERRPCFREFRRNHLRDMVVPTATA